MTVALVRGAKSALEVAQIMGAEDANAVERLMARQVRLRQYDLASGTAADAVAAIARTQLSGADAIGLAIEPFSQAAQVWGMRWQILAERELAMQAVLWP